MSKNYNRKGTIERQMQKSLASSCCCCSRARALRFAQTKPAPADAAGRRVLRVHDGPAARDARATAPARPPRISAPSGSTRQSAEIPAALAELYARLNRPAEAIAAGERAVKANPSNPEANWILGSLYARMAEMPNTRQADRRTYTERAIANLEKANRNAHPSVPTMLGRLYIADGQYDKAIAMLAPFVTDQPDQVEAVAMLAEAYQADRSRRRGDRAARKIGRGRSRAVQHARTGLSGCRPLERCRSRVCRRRRRAAAESAAAHRSGRPRC